MQFEDERKAWETKFAEIWAASPYSSVPVYYENVVAKPDHSVEQYVATTLVTGDGNQITVGTQNPRNRFAGVFIVQVFVYAGIGTQPALLMAEAIAEGFKRAVFEADASGTIRIKRPPSIQKAGVHHGRYQINVNIQYERDVYA